jgi:23S rRNA pseudouridine1911/1915/1917 synthase
MPAQQIVIDRDAPSIRLDVFLARRTELSRSQIQKHIKAGRITLNEKTVATHHLVHPGDVISITDLEVDYHERDLTSSEIAPTILAEDDDYLVVNKPSGLVVHGGPGIHERTLADWAVAHDAKIGDVGDHPEQRPGIVHRLDRDVSGVMVIAKTVKAFDDLKRQFQNHSITKEYVALAHGRLKDQAGRISFAIARKADKSGLMVARPGSKEGKTAETLFTVDRFVKSYSLVRVQTLTGRGHQIRVHFKAIGHPLVGDPLYKMKKQKPLKIPPPRVFLHATKLGFEDLRGEQRLYQSPLPTDLAQYLAKVS